MKSKKILIISIIIILILVLAIAGAVFGYLYMKTDIFKSDKELFAKYISQNLETLEKFSDIQTIKEYEELKDQEKYESDTTMKATYSEGGEVSNNINNLSAKINAQKDSSEEYFYADGQISLGEQKYLESELIRDKGIYGVRFTDVAKQFITIKDDENLANVADDLGTDTKTLEKAINVLGGVSKVSETIISSEDSEQLKNKYLSILTDAIAQGDFTSNKKAKITYQNNTISAKSYTVSLTNEQVENLLIQILNNIKDEDVIMNNLGSYKEKYQEEINNKINELTNEKEVPAVKITVYEQNQNNIRTVIEITGVEKIVIENSETSNGLKSNLQFSSINTDEIKEYDIKLTKNSGDNQEDINVTADITKGEEQYTLSFLSNVKATDASIKWDASINYKKDIINSSIILENTTTMGNDFEKKQTLSEENNFVLNDADESVRKNIIEQLKERVPEKAQTRVDLLKQALGFDTEEDNNKTIPESEMTQIDINKFNAKFEFFSGDEVSYENVNTLLQIVKDNLGSFEINEIEDPEKTNNDKDDVKYSIKIKIERNKTDEAGAAQILEKISENKKYKVAISYKEQNKMIDYITIDEVEK